MKKHRFQKISIILLCFLSGLAYGGTLGDFEHDSTTSHKKESSHKHKYSSCTTSDCDDSDHTVGDDIAESFFSQIFDSLINGTVALFSYGTQVTLDRTFNHQAVSGITQRKIGSPLLPILRVSGAWQSVYPDVEGHDFSIEAGYSLFSAQYRRTTFVEPKPRDELKLSYGLVSYRLSYDNGVEVNLGFGGAELEGSKRTTGETFCVPIVWKFANHYAFSFWQAYTTLNTVPLSDLDFSFMYIKSGLSAVVGYRSVSNPVSDLSGPYVGMSYFY